MLTAWIHGHDRRLASTRYARAVRINGAAHPDTVAAGREFAAAKLAEVMETARRYDLDELDRLAVLKTGQLPLQGAA
jgi:hypothetical protein